MRITRLIAATAMVVLIAGCGGGSSGGTTTPTSTTPPAASGGGDSAAGSVVYSKTCASCHGPDAGGLKGLGKALTGSAFMTDQSSDDLVAFLKVGRGPSDPDNTTGIQMPPRGGNPALGDDDLLDVVAYLKGLG
ncbi:MAG: cytochrome c [Actinobacteria bacterium]|nr:cytochrome c [Actinomycetota bacterium]